MSVSASNSGNLNYKDVLFGDTKNVGQLTYKEILDKTQKHMTANNAQLFSNAENEGGAGAEKEKQMRSAISEYVSSQAFTLEGFTNETLVNRLFNDMVVIPFWNIG